MWMALQIQVYIFICNTLVIGVCLFVFLFKKMQLGMMKVTDFDKISNSYWKRKFMSFNTKNVHLRCKGYVP
jgi:hypothetical protein